MQEELGSGLRLLDLEQLQLEAQNAATTLASRESDKATMTSLRRQSIQVRPAGDSLTAFEGVPALTAWIYGVSISGLQG